MRAEKSPSLISSTGVIKLMTHAMMGAALGLFFGLALVLSNPAIANLLNHGGDSAAVVFVLTLATTFAIGATLTGVVFILAEGQGILKRLKRTERFHSELLGRMAVGSLRQFNPGSSRA